MRLFVRLTAAMEALLNPEWAIPMVDSAYQRGYQAAVAAGAAELATSRAANEQLRARLEAAERPRTPKPRGVVVNRTTAAGNVIDEWPSGDTWKLRIVPASGDQPEEAWLLISDERGRRVATYKPGYWDMIEAGRTNDIKIKNEAESAS